MVSQPVSRLLVIAHANIALFVYAGKFGEVVSKSALSSLRKFLFNASLHDAIVSGLANLYAIALAPLSKTFSSGSMQKSLRMISFVVSSAIVTHREITG